MRTKRQIKINVSVSKMDYLIVEKIINCNKINLKQIKNTIETKIIIMLMSK